MSNNLVQPSLAQGTVLHNTYRIERVLGQGGFGITYLATDLSLDRLVAVKEFFPQDFCNRDAASSHVTVGAESNRDLIRSLRDKFLKEARNIAKFNHPNIIRVIAAFEANNTAYYVMEYIEGISLDEMVSRYGPLKPQRALEFITRIGEALVYVHARKVNHLDVKPANIMVRIADETPVLIDFGLAKQYDAHGHQTSTTITGISHGYAPMEQYKDGGVSQFTPQSDIYSLGATMYYLLTGKVPPNALDLAEGSLVFDPSIPSEFTVAIPKAMSFFRKDRYATVPEFLHALQSENEVGDAVVETVLPIDPKPSIPTEINPAIKPDKKSGKRSDRKTKIISDKKAESTILITPDIAEIPPAKKSKVQRVKLVGAILAGLVCLAGIIIVALNLSDGKDDTASVATTHHTRTSSKSTVMSSTSDDKPEETQSERQDDEEDGVSAETEAAETNMDDNGEATVSATEKSPAPEATVKSEAKAEKPEPAKVSSDDEKFAKASSLSDYQELANRGYAKAYAPLAQMYLKARNYQMADTYAQKALKANVGTAQAKDVINKLDVLDYYHGTKLPDKEER